MRSSREIGETLDMSAAAVDQAVYEMRKRYRGILLREVAATLEEGERAEDEEESPRSFRHIGVQYFAG